MTVFRAETSTTTDAGRDLVGAVRRRLGRRPRVGWQDVVAAYLRHPSDMWGPAAPRHAEKLERKKRALHDRDGLSDDEIVEAVVAMAAKRRRERPPPVYVTGLGGSGSHWVAGMLNDLPGLVAAGEVYFPPRLLEALSQHDADEQACAIDAVHVLHGWPRSHDVWASSIVNCASGVGMLRSYKRWDPRAVGIHLVRDPRDQVLSVTFRKPRYRQYVAPDASDREYLERMARRNARSHVTARAVRDLVDITCRYEQLRDDPRPLLRDVAAALAHTISERVIDRVAVDHSAEVIRAGRGARSTNLDEGGRAHSWRIAADPAQQRLLHMHLVDAIHDLGYPPGDCTGAPVADPALPERTLHFAGAPPGPLYRREGDEWTRIASDGDLTVPAGVPALLRVPTGAGGLRSLQQCGPDDIQALCLAANADVDDDALADVAGLRGLRALDLARTRVTDAGLEHLAELPGLLHLHLAATGTTAEGRARLARRSSQLTIWV